MGRKYYDTCRICGANLDPGEPCDCEEVKAEKKRRMEKLIKTQKGQLEFDFSCRTDEKAIC